MNKKILWGIAAGVVVLGAIVYLRHDRIDSSGRPDGRRGMDPNRPVPVAVAEVKRGDIDVVVNAIGTVTALNTITVKPRVDGLLQRIVFREGQLVKAGDVLAEIDPRPFQAQLDQSAGQLARDQALLTNARIDAERYRKLAAQDSIARQQVDTQEALVKQYEGTVLADKGSVDSAKLQLGFTRISAPVTGRLGLRQVDMGNMVHASDTTGIVVITQTQPITTVFSIPADHIAAVQQAVRSGQTLQVEAWDREAKNLLATGKLMTLDNQIDTTTGTVKLKAEFENKDDALFPNQFVNARLRVETRHDAKLVPVSAIQRGSLGTFVYVVNKEDKTVSTRAVTLGPTSGEIVAIEKGVEAGETVVADGADKLRQGGRVELPGAETKGSPPVGRDKAKNDGKGDGKTDGPRESRRAGHGDAPAAAAAPGRE